jgi:hypothetical protein
MSEMVMMGLLYVLGKQLEAAVGPDCGFAIFVDWRDGRPCSYLSNGKRSQVTEELRGWLVRTGRGDPTLAEEQGGVPSLEVRCAEVGKAMVEEDIDVVLFLFDGSDLAWFSSMQNGRELVERWVAHEMGKS